MRILIIWGESLGKPGGGTAHCLGLAGGLKSWGHQVVILAPRYGQTPLNTNGLDVRPIPLPPRGMFSFLCFQLITVLFLPYWLFRHRPQAVYVRTCFLQGIMALITRAAGVPLVGEVDGIVDQEILMRGQPRLGAVLIRGLDRFNNRLSSGLVCVTRGLMAESIRRGGSPATTVAIPNGARIGVMRSTDRLAARAQLGLPEKGVIVGFAGTFAPWQGLDFLVAAAETLRDQPHLNVKLALMGGGQMEAKVAEWVERRELAELFVFLPPGPQEQVAQFLNACDAVVVPIHDLRKLRYGLSVLKFWDAVSVGLPVFVPKCSELDEVLADLGLPGVFDPAEPESLAAAIAQFADDVETYRAQRGRVHRRVAERYSWYRVAEQVAAFLQRLCASRREAA